MNYNPKNSTILCKLSDKLTAVWKNSIFSHAFFHDEKDKTESSFVISKIKKVPLKKYVFNPIKSFISKAFDKSFLVGKFLSFFEYLLSISLKCYGWCALAFVLISLLFNVLNHSFSEDIALKSIIAIISLFPVLFVNKSLSLVICSSGIFSFLFLKILNCEKLTYYAENKSKGSVSGSIIVGFIASFFTLAYTRTEIVVFVILLTLTAIFMCRPETAVLTLSFILVFSPYKITIYLTLVALVSYLIKVIRGKRSLYISLYDVFPLAFIALYAIMPSYENGSSIVIMMPLLYFLYSGILRNEDLALTALKNFSISTSVFAFYNLLVYFLQKYLDDFSDSFVAQLHKLTPFSDKESFSLFYVLAIVFFVCMASFGKEKLRVAFLGALLNAVALYFSGERFLFISCVLSIVFMALNIFKNKIVVLFVSSAFIALSIKLLSVFSADESGINRALNLLFKYKNCLWFGTNDSHIIYNAEKISDSGSLWLQLAFWGGLISSVGIFVSAFMFLRNCMPRYEIKSKGINTVSTVIACFLFAYITSSFVCFSWSDHRVYCLFWMLGGISSAIRRFSINEKIILELEYS